MMPKSALSLSILYFPALVSGLLLTAAFPDTGMYGVLFFALVPFWVSLGSMTPRQGFGAGWVMGMAHYLSLIYWLVPTLTTFGGLHFILALACLVLLCAYLALFPGFFAFILRRWPMPGAWIPLWGAVVWVGLEYLRTHALTGFPWGVLGYSQYANLALLQMADITGVLGISFVLVACNGTLATAWPYVQGLFTSPPNLPPIRPLMPALVCGPLLLGLALGYGLFRLDQVTQEVQTAPTTTITLVQGNIRQDQKWDRAFKDMTVDRYAALTLEAGPSDLVVWPETALPFHYGRDPVYSSRVDALVRQKRTALLTGSPAAEPREQGGFRYYNRAYMLNPMGMVTGHYDKTHLVPFGEYVPLEDLLFFVEKLTAEAGNFSKGRTGPLPLSFGDHTTGVLICFEVLFPDLARHFVLNHADILTTMTNDGWFGRTSAPAQHFAIAVLRAVENRRAMVRAANTGISGIILPTGQIESRTGLFETAAVTSTVPLLSETGFYTRHGDLLGQAALVAMAFYFMIKGIKKSFRRP